MYKDNLKELEEAIKELDGFRPEIRTNLNGAGLFYPRRPLTEEEADDSLQRWRIYSAVKKDLLDICDSKEEFDKIHAYVLKMLKL